MKMVIFSDFVRVIICLLRWKISLSKVTLNKLYKPGHPTKYEFPANLYFN